MSDDEQRVEEPKRYYTLVLQPSEPESLSAARDMTTYLASRLDVVTLSISESQLSEQVNTIMAEMVSGEMDRDLEGR